MHEAVFFLDCLFAGAMQEGLDFGSLLSHCSSDTHHHPANQLLRGLSRSLLYKFFGKNKKKNPQQKTQSKGTTRLPRCAKVALCTWDVSKQHMSYYRKLLISKSKLLSWIMHLGQAKAR